jgi:hypothetical protein
MTDIIVLDSLLDGRNNGVALAAELDGIAQGDLVSLLYNLVAFADLSLNVVEVLPHFFHIF